MPRYGKSAEDFNRESAALEAARKARQGVAAAEAQLTGALDSSSNALDRATAKTRLYNKAKQEQSSFEDRQAKANVEEAASIDVNTAAIERNAAARRRAASIGTQALTGARDPLFARASQLADPETGVSRYQLRRELAIGDSRATRLQAAVQTPGLSPGNAGAVGANTRVQAAEAEVAAADTAYARAMRERRVALDREDEAAVLAANSARDLARARQKSANAELESARASEANAAAIVKDTESRTRAASGPGQALIRHPELYGKQAFAPVGPELTSTRPVTGEAPARYLGVGDAADVHTSKVDAATASQARLTEARQATIRADQMLLQQDVDELMGRQATATERAARATHYSSVELGTASQQMTRHGALTSEFITAAARGETTLREMGNQALVTAGKFSAWTGAASAIYGAVAAVHQLGEGAIQSSSGVNQLRRVVNDVNPDTAQQAFRGLAGEFNVPVKDASDAVYRMGQVFHSQADAVTAAKAALYSYKTGEVDVASSTQNLIAIVRGFGLSSDDLLKVYDQINQAQNTFGIRIKDTEEGLAKAGGTFRNSGGDLNYLLGLFVAIQKATGRSGTEIGTGIARAANQIRKPTAQATLRGLGVDVDPDNLQKTLQSALKVSQRPGSNYNAIAAGLFGNQYARLIAPVLRDQTTLNQALKETSPEASKNSAQKELAKTLGQVDEQIKKVGISLERLGSGLAQAGAFDFIGLLLHGLNGALDVANSLVDAFDKLPEPLRTGLSLLGETYALMLLIRKVAPGAPLVGSPEAKQARLIQAGQGSAVQAAIDEREALVRQARRATGAAERSRSIITEFDRGYPAAIQAAGGDQEKIAEINRQRKLLEEGALRAEAEGLRLQLLANEARKQVVFSETEQARYKQIEADLGAKGVIAEGARQRLTQPAEFGLNSTGAVPIQREGVGAMTGLPMMIPQGMSDAEAGAVAEREAGRLERAAAPVAGQLRNYAEKTTTLSGKVLGPAASRAAGALEGAAGAVGRSGAVLGRLGTAFGGLMSMFGPLEIGLVTFIGGEALIHHFIGNMEKHTRELESLTSDQAPDPQAYQQRFDDLQKKHEQYVKIMADRAKHPGAPGLKPDDALTAEEQTYQTMVQVQNRQIANRNAGKPIPQLFVGQITKSMHQDARLRDEGVISLKEFDKRLHTHMIELQTAYNNSDTGAVGRAKTLADQLKRQVANPSDFERRFGGLDLKGLQTAMKATTAQLQTAAGRNDPKLMNELGAEYGYIRRQLAGSSDPQAILDLMSARGDFFQGIENAVNAELQAALSTARTPADHRAAFATARRRLSTELVKPSSDALRKDLSRRDDAEQTVAADQGMVERYGRLPGVGNALRNKLKKDTENLKRLRTSVTNDAKDVAAAYAQRHDDLEQLKNQEFQDREQSRQVELAYRQSTTTDKSAQDSMAIQSARGAVADAARTYGVGSDQWKQAMTTLNNARHSATQDILSDVDSENALITARASGDPASAARAAVTVAQRTLDATRRASPNDRNAIRQAQAALISANIAYSHFLRDQATAISQARFSLREANTDDPIKKAEIELEAARKAISQATTPQDKITAQADYQQKRRALRDLKVTTREDDVQWQLDMDKITRDQAISQYQQILRSSHLTKQMRRDLQLKIHQLQQQANQDATSFDLAVGAGIKLPTVYDVRRSIKTARMGGDQGTQVNANNKVDVNVTVNDPNAAGAVFDAIDQAMGTTVSATLRQAGVV